MSDKVLAEMKAKLGYIQAQNKALDRNISKSLSTQRKVLAEQKKKNPRAVIEDRSVIAHSQFMHHSDQFAVPIQNWKDGTPFYRERNRGQIKKNVHSARVMRSLKVPLEEREADQIMNMRDEMATVELPLNGGVFEVVPTHTAPLDLERKCIWKEYL